MKSKVLPIVVLVLAVLFFARDVRAASRSYIVRSEGCHTYSLYAHQDTEDKPIEGIPCDNSEQVITEEVRKVKHSDSTPIVPTMALEPIEPVITATPIPVTPGPTESPVEPVECVDDEDDGIGEDDSIDDQEPEDCEDNDESQ